MFINRKKELEWLESMAHALRNKKGMNGAILGLRRIGKTELVLEFKKKYRYKEMLMPYLNVQSSMSSPKRFCLDFIYALLEEICRYKEIEIPEERGLEDDIPVIAALIDKKLYTETILLLSLINRKNSEEALRLLFRLPEIISGIIGVKFLFIIDEFQEINDLKNYGLEIFSLMRSVIEKQTSVKYIVTGSLISFMEALFKDSHKPFFNQFSMIRLSYFNCDDTKALASNIWDYEFVEVKKDAYSALYNLTGGHPFYAVSVCERAFFECRYNDFKIDRQIVEYAFLKETLDREGKLNILFHYIYDHSLEKVQRKGSLKAPLIVLAEREELTLSEISRALNRPSGQISNIMKSLLKTDMIIRKENKYYFRDSVFRMWLAKTSLGKDLGIIFKKDIVSSYINNIKERYLCKSTELGRMKEFELYYFVSENQGKEVGGTKLPMFRKIIKNYLLTDGTELDLFAVNNESWAFEIKWKNKQTGMKDIKKFIKKIKADKYVYISREGFTDEALTHCKKKDNVLLWKGEDIVC